MKQPKYPQMAYSAVALGKDDFVIDEVLGRLWLLIARKIRIKQRVYMHIAQGPAREREALKRAKR